MKLIPVKQYLHENKEFTDHPDCQETIFSCIDFYKRVGFNLPWICYYVQLNEQFVGAAAFKGKPAYGKVEIAYGTFPQYQHQGIGAKIARALIQLSLKTDPSVMITARTLPEENFSARILRKNNFKLSGTVADPEDGNVWEWVYIPVNP